MDSSLSKLTDVGFSELRSLFSFKHDHCEEILVPGEDDLRSSQHFKDLNIDDTKDVYEPLNAN